MYVLDAYMLCWLPAAPAASCPEDTCTLITTPLFSLDTRHCLSSGLGVEGVILPPGVQGMPPALSHGAELLWGTHPTLLFFVGFLSP